MHRLKTAVCAAVCLAVAVSVPLVAFSKDSGGGNTEKSLLKIWQIDSFEGGVGSRADYLQTIGDEYSEISDCYVTVASLSAEAARLNIKNGALPDLISYGAGMYGIEDVILGWDCWCRGGYCVLTVDADADFSDMNAENTVINGGRDNLTEAAALLSGLSDCETLSPTSAYVSLLGGKYRYLFGTQRDIYRLKTRKATFTVLPVTVFNDLYQNISAVKDGANSDKAQGFIDYLLSKAADAVKLGLINDSTKYDDEMSEMTGLDFEYKLTTPVSESYISEAKKFIASGDINSLKKLFK